MKPEELFIAARVEEAEPTDRVRGTVVAVDKSGMFVVKYDNGDYLAYQDDQLPGFIAIPQKPIPTHARSMMAALHQEHGRTPPEDVVGVRKVPGARKANGAKSSKPALTREAHPPTIES